MTAIGFFAKNPSHVRAGGNAVAKEPLLVGQPKHAVAPVLMMIKRAQNSRSPTHTPNGADEIDAVGVGGDELGAETLGLLHRT